MSRSEAVVLIYGEGGHQKEMELFIDTLPKNDTIFYILLGPHKIKKNNSTYFYLNDIRHKNNRLKSVYMSAKHILLTLHTLLKISLKYKSLGIISTGPGIAILPFAIFKLLKVKTIYIESFCRFKTSSIAGRAMYKISNRFLVQNEELLAIYPKAEYSGRL